MLQAPMLDDGLSSTEVGIGRRYIIKALMIAMMVVVFDERLDLVFYIAPFGQSP